MIGRKKIADQRYDCNAAQGWSQRVFIKYLQIDRSQKVHKQLKRSIPVNPVAPQEDRQPEKVDQEVPYCSFAEKKQDKKELSQLLPQKSCNVEPFINTLDMIDDLYNKPVEIAVDRDNLYVLNAQEMAL